MSLWNRIKKWFEPVEPSTPPPSKYNDKPCRFCDHRLTAYSYWAFNEWQVWTRCKVCGVTEWEFGLTDKEMREWYDIPQRKLNHMRGKAGQKTYVEVPDEQ